ncbi:hypothetical protein ACHWQZ_G004105 [Mnemiopsis leidyi]
MRLSDSLQSFQCWDELVEQCQGELKFVDEIKSYFTQRKKLEEDYAESIRRLDAQFVKQCNNLTNTTSYCTKTWLKLLEQSTKAANCMSEGVDTFEKEILPEITAVSEKKKKSIVELVTTKNRLESHMSLVGKDIGKLQNSIEDFAKATEANKIKYEEGVNRERTNTEYKEKYKTRFVSNAAKLQEFNNDYNILLNVVTMHETSYIEHILPAWIDYHQHLLTNQIADIKSLLRYSFEILLHHDEGYTLAMSNIYSYVSKINFDSEYTDFSQSHARCCQLKPNCEDYNTSLQRYTSLNLPIKQLIVNELTDSTLRAKLDAHKTDLKYIDEKLESKSKKLEEFETKPLKDNREKSDKERDECKKLNIKAHIHELSAQRCRYQMTVNFISESLEPWEGKPLEPFYNLLPMTIDPIRGNTLSNFSQSMMLPQCLGAISPATQRKPNATLTKLKNLLTLGRQTSFESPKDHSLGTPVAMKWEEDEDKDYVIMTKEDGTSSSSGSQEAEEDEECPKVLLDTESNDTLENQPWFHNDITRQETAELLQLKGQFLIRKTIDSKRRTAVLVLSVNVGSVGIKHFVMQLNDKGQFRLEGVWFNSIQQLLNYHIDTGKPITNKMNVGIRVAVLRDRWNLHHKDIRLKQFLGKGNFGDVYQAQLLTNTREVAVKTCRDPESFRDKFLEEADTLKKFKHKNVVKLLGICCDEMPYYIVMEFMNNGSLLSILQEGPPQSIKQLVHYCEQAAAGMQYLHSQNYIHRDLAARNCLVHNHTLLKISDFGMSRYQGENSIYISKMKQIPIRWTAPECLMFRTYTFKSDIWSYGILMWEIFNRGAYPYSEMSNRDVKDQIDAGYRLPKSRDTPPNIYQVMFGCWKYEPKGRPNFDEIHQAVKDIYIEFYAEHPRLSSVSSLGSNRS